MVGDIIDISLFFNDYCSMIIDRHIKPHDFVSGKPKSRFSNLLRFLPTTNPCREITLGVDPVDCMLGQGFEAGELGITMAPPSNSRSYYTAQREPERRVVNLDFASLYDQVQVSYDDIRPEGYENWTDAQKFAHKIMLNSSY